MLRRPEKVLAKHVKILLALTLIKSTDNDQEIPRCRKNSFHRAADLTCMGLTIRDGLKISVLLYSSNGLLTTRFNRRLVRRACRPWLNTELSCKDEANLWNS